MAYRDPGAQIHAWGPRWIFLGKMTKWDDPLLTKLTLTPSSQITISSLHSAPTGSGTTYVWTDYLAKVSEEWNSDVGFGTTVPWPVGIAGRGNGGVLLS